MSDQTAVSGKVVSPSRLAHFVLRTHEANFEPMVAFYKTFLGAHAVLEYPKMSFLTYDDEHHRIGIISSPTCRESDRTTAGLEHVAFGFKSMSDMALSYQHKKANNILPLRSVSNGATTSMYYKDPDGNEVEVLVDTFDTAEETMEFLASPAFTEKRAARFDPEELVELVESGKDELDIKKGVYWV